MSPIEVMARAICCENGCVNPENCGWWYDQRKATRALLALSQMEPTPGMVEAARNELFELIGVSMSNAAFIHLFQTMLAAAVKESSAGSTQT